MFLDGFFFSGDLENFVDIENSYASIETTFDCPVSSEKFCESFTDEIAYFRRVDSSMIPGFRENKGELYPVSLESCRFQVSHEGKIGFPEVTDQGREGE